MIKSAVLVAALVAAAPGKASATLPSSRDSVEASERDPEDAVRSVLAAHAAAKAGHREEARTVYLSASRQFPAVRDWLLLRVAALSTDSTQRASIYAGLRLPTAKGYAALVEARALEAAGVLGRAADQYELAGRPADAARLRLQLLPGINDRKALYEELLQRIERGGSEREVAMADLLAGALAELSAKARLRLARFYLDRRIARRAADLCPGALKSRAPLAATAADSLGCAEAMVNGGKSREALPVLTRLARSPRVASAALYQQARAQLRLGADAAARTALRQIVTRRPADPRVAPAALLLLGELAWQGGARDKARQQWLELARRYPEASSAPRARFLAALTAWETGEPAAAAAEWEALFEQVRGPDATAAGYWAGVARAKLGQEAEARQRWQDVVARDSAGHFATYSYYTIKSHERLGLALTPPPGVVRPAPITLSILGVTMDARDSAFVRLGLLRRLAMQAEEELEREALLGEAGRDRTALVELAAGLNAHGYVSNGISMARRALSAGAAPDLTMQRLVFPLGYSRELNRRAREHQLAPSFIAALIRQESAWEPRATSAVGARGLMQLMPATAAALARRAALTAWHADQLYEPSVNLRLGSAYLAESLARFGGDPVRALAAYNAGPSRVKLWDSRLRDHDPELFIERISIDETRHYVRAVLRNQAIYAALYGEG